MAELDAGDECRLSFAVSASLSFTFAMIRFITVAVTLSIVVAGCSSGPKYISACDLMRAYESNKTQTLETYHLTQRIHTYHYCGETNDVVFVRFWRAWLGGGKLESRMLFAETN